MPFDPTDGTTALALVACSPLASSLASPCSGRGLGRGSDVIAAGAIVCVLVFAPIRSTDPGHRATACPSGHGVVVRHGTRPGPRRCLSQAQALAWPALARQVGDGSGTPGTVSAFA